MRKRECAMAALRVRNDELNVRAATRFCIARNYNGKVLD